MGYCQGEGQGGCRVDSIGRVQAQESMPMPEQEEIDGIDWAQGNGLKCRVQAGAPNICRDSLWLRS